MKKLIFGGITTTALTTVLGASLFLNCPLTKAVEAQTNPNTVSNQPLPQTTANLTTSEISPINEGESIESNTPQSPKEKLTGETPIATIHSHPWKGSQAVTVRVQQIPVLTFLSSPKTSHASQAKENDFSANHPLTRAKAFAARLNQLSQNKVDASQILVSQGAQKGVYNITFNGEVLASIDGQTRLPDTTKNLATDALQATNRLRRLLGNASPLAAIDKDEIQDISLAQDTKTKGRQKRGIASWYGPGFHGQRTASGERFNQHAYTAAHRSLPFGTQVRVTNLRNGRSVIVRINDRGPHARGRVIDLSSGAARAIGVNGTAPVKIEVLGI